MSRAHSQANIGRCLLAGMVFATLAIFPAQAAETQERKPLTKPGQTYVGIDVPGCADKCKQLVEFISTGDFFKERTVCAEAAGHTSITLLSAAGGEPKKSTYSFGCPGDADTATSLISQFVDGSGTWKLINRNWKYWTEKKFDSK